MVNRLMHRLRGHKLTKVGPIQPTYVTKGGIRVFEQDTFQAPVKHWDCSCGETLY